MSLYGALAEAKRRGERLDRGQVTFSGNTTTVQTNIETSQCVVVSLVGTGAPASGQQVTGSVAAGGLLTISQFAAGAPTANTITVAWIVIGTSLHGNS